MTNIPMRFGFGVHDDLRETASLPDIAHEKTDAESTPGRMDPEGKYGARIFSAEAAQREASKYITSRIMR